VAKPLTKLTRKNEEFIWSPSQQETFEDMKVRLCTTPVLAYPNFELPFILTTDASKVGVAAILSQVQDGVQRPIAYASRQVNKAGKAHSDSEAEMLALVCATKYFCCHLYGKQFLVRTDHSALSLIIIVDLRDGVSNCPSWTLLSSTEQDLKEVTSML